MTIVTHNSAPFIRHCLTHLLETHQPAPPIVIVDNASSDNTRAILSEFASRAQIVLNPQNTGFAAAQNHAIALTHTPWVLVLNPDVRLTVGFVSQLLAAAQYHPRIGTVCGKLLALGPDFQIPANPVLDSTGIYFTPELRHFDRGSRQPDQGQYNRVEYVFGATGAAALYRREMIEDVSIHGQFFDEDFFAYREDADVAWRAQLLGWRCVYTPEAVAYHVRSVLPTNRRQVSVLVNYHSVKNRFLMRIKNIDRSLYLRHALAITWRDLIVLAGCLLREHSSLAAVGFVAQNWARMLEKRRAVMARRRVAPAEIARWFSRAPVAFPVEGTSG